MAPKVWLITGSSSGFGLAVVKLLLVIKLDVSKPEEIISAFAVAHEKFDRIDVVYNNAGYGLIAEVESVPDQLARNMFEVNFWGAANISREAIRVFRDVNKPSGGRLIQASSGAGITGIPTCGYYCASNFALVGLSETIDKEADPSWNIKVTIFDIGAFRTRGLDPSFLIIIPQHPKYENTTSAIRSLFTLSEDQISIGDSNKAAREIHNIASDKDAPLRISYGLDAIETTKGKIDLLKDNVEKSVVYSVDLK
ncbi:hypothetical protein BDQ17DRAFT_1329685 [Cyathus striatus]|nr:hypothetical protein BDQ17DRAFT_1329685 [Cyathus striatus]